MKLLLLLSLFLGFAQALLEERFVAFEYLENSFEIQHSTIFYDESDPVGIRIAIKSLSSDLKQITDFDISTTSWESSQSNGSIPSSNSTAASAIIVATLSSPLVQHLQDRHELDLSSIAGKWETFATIALREPLPGINHGLLIVGSDKRGTMYGAYTLAEQCGQSPLHWWADVPAKKHEKIFALPKSTVHGEPSVKFRGIFVNDEAPGLTGWWAGRTNNTNYTLDAEFYEHVFDLLLRLKGNILWPAMWASFVPKPGRIFFTDDPRNQQLANDYGIVISTSHHEPMQRATNEWDADQEGEWSWVTNKENVVKFMEEGVRRAGQNESYFTLGMRGPNDGPMDAEDPVTVLKDVFERQREILAHFYGNESAANQVWTIYKEVHTYYAAGLVPPEDVTLMFTDDNWGNVQRLPTEAERKRSGGIGLYFHFEYVGNPKSWKWHNTNNIPKVYKELSQAYERGADRIWIINVGDIKPMEVPLSFSMDLAWNTSRFSFDSIPDYLEELAVRDFGSDVAQSISRALMQHSHLVGKRKYEMTIPETYSQLNFREAERVLTAWKSLADDVLEIRDEVPEALQDALYHLLVYPVLSGYHYHLTVIGQAQNYQFSLERRNTANEVAQRVLRSFDEDYDLVAQYDRISNGKWKGIMSTPKYDTGLDKWHPPARDVLSNLSYVQLRQDYDYSFGNLGIYAEGSRSASRQGRICGACDPALPTSGSYSPTLPMMDLYGPSIRTIDLFHRGNYLTPIDWTIQTPHPWIKVSPTSGSLGEHRQEQILNVSIDWSSVPDSFDETVSLRVEWDFGSYFDLVKLPVRKKTVPEGFVGFPESNNHVSMEGPHFQHSSDGPVSFAPIKYLGSRSESGSIALRPYVESRDDTNAAQAAWVDYDFYVVNASLQANATIYVNGALDTDPNLPMKFSLRLTSRSNSTNFQRLLSEPKVAGDTPEEWMAAVADHVWTREIQLGKLAPGKHTLRWQVNSPEVYLEKIVVWLQGPPVQSNLGPPETRLLGEDD